MNDDVDIVVDDLLSQLKGVNVARKELDKPELNLDKEDVNRRITNFEEARKRFCFQSVKFNIFFSILYCFFSNPINWASK